MYQEKKEEGDLPVLRIVLTHQYNKLKTGYKSVGRRITSTIKIIDITKTNTMTMTRKEKWEEKKNSKEVLRD